MKDSYLTSSQLMRQVSHDNARGQVNGGLLADSLECTPITGKHQTQPSKPRIKLDHSRWLDGALHWKCSDAVTAAWGKTPGDAFWRWERDRLWLRNLDTMMDLTRYSGKERRK